MSDVGKEAKISQGFLANKYEFCFFADDIWQQGMTKGHYEPFESLLILNQLKSGDVVIDVGANIGYYSLLMASKVGPTGKVYAFEPDPSNRSILKKNVEANGLSNLIYIYDFAVYSREGESELYLSDENKGDHWLSFDCDKNKPRKKITVKTTTLDLFWKSINCPLVNLIKIDTQGSEPYIIHGGETLIQSCRPDLFFEYWPYAYQLLGANFTGMKQFLRNIYKDFYFIDRPDQRLFTIQDPFLQRFCQKVEGKMHADLICTLKLKKI
jgi:FkbM family methyltransferase